MKERVAAGKDRDGKEEARAFAQITLYPHFATVQLNKALADWNPQPGALSPSPAILADLLEVFKDLLQVLLGDAGASIFHADQKGIILVPVQVDDHRTVVCKAQAVVD